MTDWLIRGLHRAPDGDDGDGGKGSDGGDGGDHDRGGSGNGDGGGKGGSDDDGQQGGKGGDKDVTMKQSDLDAMMAGRADRGSKSALATMATEAGFDSIDDMKAAAKRDTDRADADKTDTERAKDAQTDAERSRDAVAESLKVERVANAFQLAALKANIPADRTGDALALTDLSEMTIDDQGTVTGADEAVKKLIDDKPWVTGGNDVGNGNGTGADGGARGPAGGGKARAVSAATLDMSGKLGMTGPDLGERVANAATSVDTETNRQYISGMRDRIAKDLTDRK